jgi:hypothetical protein
MTTQLRIQIASFSLAALVTLATVMGLNSLAHSTGQDSAQLAKAIATQAT